MHAFLQKDAWGFKIFWQKFFADILLAGAITLSVVDTLSFFSGHATVNITIGDFKNPQVFSLVFYSPEASIQYYLRGSFISVVLDPGGSKIIFLFWYFIRPPGGASISKFLFSQQCLRVRSVREDRINYRRSLKGFQYFIRPNGRALLIERCNFNI